MHIGFLILIAMLALIYIYIKQILIFVLIGCLIVGIYYIFNAYKRNSNNKKFHNLNIDLMEAYKLNENIGEFLTDIDYIKSHKKINIIVSQVHPVNVLKLILHIGDVDVLAKEMKWSADVGILDEKTYTLAKANYQLALNKYKNDKTVFQEIEKKKKATKKGYEPLIWPGEKPDRIYREDFTHFTPQDGFLNGETTLHWILVAAPELKDEKQKVTPNFKFDIQHFISFHKVIDFYKSLSSDELFSRKLKTKSNNIDISFIIENYRAYILSSIGSLNINNIKNVVLDYQSGFSISETNGYSIRLPFVITNSLINGEPCVTYHDHAHPDTEIKIN